MLRTCRCRFQQVFGPCSKPSLLNQSSAGIGSIHFVSSEHACVMCCPADAVSIECRQS